MAYNGRFDKKRADQGEVVGGGFIVFRRGKKWNRVRIQFKDWMKFFAPFEHATRADAKAEAIRLSLKNPGECFCVFQQVYSTKDNE